MFVLSNKASAFEPLFSQNSWKSLCPRRKKSGKSQSATKYPAITGNIYARLVLGRLLDSKRDAHE